MTLACSDIQYSMTINLDGALLKSMIRKRLRRLPETTISGRFRAHPICSAYIQLSLPDKVSRVSTEIGSLARLVPRRLLSAWVDKSCCRRVYIGFRV